MNISFTPDIETILENVRINCCILTEYHRRNFLSLNQSIKYYRIPVLLLSSIASVWSVSGTSFLNQNIVSLINCLMGLIAGTITSIELFQKIDMKMQLSEELSHKFYILSADIFKNLSLKDENREVKGKQYLNEVFVDYIKLIEKSNILDKKIKDELLPLPINRLLTTHSLNTSSSSSSINSPRIELTLSRPQTESESSGDINTF